MTENSQYGTSGLLLQLAGTKSEPVRLSLLLSLSKQLLAEQPQKALSSAKEALDLAERLKKRTAIPDCLRQVGECCLVLGDIDSGIKYLRKLLPYFSEVKEEEAELYIKIGGLEVERGRYRKGMECYQSGLGMYEELQDLVGQWNGLKGLGDLYTKLTDTERALDFSLRALRVAEESELDELLGVSLSDVGLIYSELKDYDKALDYLERCRQVFQRSGLKDLEVRALANVASIYTVQGKLDAALDYGLRAMTIYEALADRRGLAAMLTNLSNIYEQQGEFSAALEYSRKAFDLFQYLNNPEGECQTLINTSILYQTTGEHNNALYILEQGLRVAIREKFTVLEYECHQLLSVSLEQLGDATRALRHLRAYTSIREKIEGEERRKGIKDLQAKFDLEQTEKEREIYRLRNEQLELANTHQNAELTSLSMRLVEKSRFINDIKLAIEKIAPSVSEDIGSVLNQVLRKIKQQASSKEDWQAFEEQFRKVHHGFIQKLSQTYPTLTSTELKVCALIRTGLSSSEIASLLHVTKRNIDTHRYRLRKKLDIGTEVDLGNFLAGL